MLVESGRGVKRLTAESIHPYLYRAIARSRGFRRVPRAISLMSTLENRRTLRLLLRAPAYLYRWHLGRLLGHRFLLLTHIGRRTGIKRQTVLEVMEYRKETREAVVMSGFGRDSDWLRNIETNASAELYIASEHFAATFRFLSEEEAIRVVAGYEHRNRFMGPILRWVLSRLLGWDYRGLDADRRKLVTQLPLIAFRTRL